MTASGIDRRSACDLQSYFAAIGTVVKSRLSLLSRRLLRDTFAPPNAATGRGCNRSLSSESCDAEGQTQQCARAPAADAFGKILERQSNVRHDFETETSMILALHPELVDPDRAAEAIGPTAPEVVSVVACILFRQNKNGS